MKLIKNANRNLNKLWSENLENQKKLWSENLEKWNQEAWSENLESQVLAILLVERWEAWFSHLDMILEKNGEKRYYHMCMSVFQFNVDIYISLILLRKLVFTCLHQVVQAQPHDGWVFCLDIIFYCLHLKSVLWR